MMNKNYFLVKVAICYTVRNIKARIYQTQPHVFYDMSSLSFLLNA